jgi:hypothetical protein
LFFRHRCWLAAVVANQLMSLGDGRMTLLAALVGLKFVG